MACKVQRSKSTYEKWAANREIDVWLTAARASRYVVQFYDASYNMDTQEVRMYTELCEGGDAHKLINRIRACPNGERRIHPLIIYHVGLQIAWGLADIQVEKILHRDLKTDNVLMTVEITAKMNRALWSLTQESTLPDDCSNDFNALCNKLYERDQRLCVLTDFGLSRNENRDERSTYTMGPDARWTVGTSAPELQFYNHQSSKADIYSAGVLIYMLCTQKGPPNPGTPFDRLPDYYDPGLQQLIDECLEWSDPLKRPTAGNMVKRLNQLKLVEAGRINEALSKDKTTKYQKQKDQYRAEQLRQADLEELAAQRDADAAIERLKEVKAWKEILVAKAKADKGPAQVPGRISKFSREDRVAHLANGLGNAADIVPLKANRPAPAPPHQRQDGNARKQLEDQQRARLAEEQRRQREADQKAAAAAEEQRRQKIKEKEEADKKAAEEERRRRDEEQRRQQAEEERRRKIKEKEEADRRAAEEERRRQAEEERRRKIKEKEEANRRAAEEERRRQAEEQRRQQAEEQRRQQAAEQRRQRAEEQRRQQAEEQRRQQAEEQRRQRVKEKEEADRRAVEEERRRQAEEQRRQQAADQRRQQAEDQRRQQAEDQRRQQAEDQRRRQAEEERRQRAEEQRRRKKKDKEEADKKAAEDEQRRQADEQRRQRAEEQRRRQVEEQWRQQEADRIAAELAEKLAKVKKQQKEEEDEKTRLHEEAMWRAIQNAGPKPRPQLKLKPKPAVPAEQPGYLPAPQPFRPYDPAREEQLRPKDDINAERARMPPLPPQPVPQPPVYPRR